MKCIIVYRAAGSHLCLKRIQALGGWEIVVFDRVCRTQHLALLKARERVQQGQLQALWQPRREALDVQLGRGPALGLKEDLLTGTRFKDGKDEDYPLGHFL